MKPAPQAYADVHHFTRQAVRAIGAVFFVLPIVVALSVASVILFVQLFLINPILALATIYIFSLYWRTRR